MGLLDWATRTALPQNATSAGQAGTRTSEVRSAPFSLASPTQWTGPKQGLMPTWDGQKAVDSAYAGNLYVFRCIDATANAIARLPFRACTDPEKPEQFSSAQYSKLAYLLSPAPGSPNPQWSARQLWKYSITQYLVTGKWVWMNEFNPAGQLIRLWPIPAQYIEPVPAPWGSTGDEYFTEFIYRVRGREVRIPRKKLSYFWNPSQADHLQPESPLGPAAGRIGLAQMLERYDLALMKNNCVPTTLITTEPFATKEDRRSFRQQFVSNFGGYDNVGKAIFAEADPDTNPDGSTGNNVSGKISVERLGMTAEELQQNEKYTQVIDDILVALGTPKSVLGIAKESTFDNAKQDLTNWWNEKLLPLKSDLEDQINVRFAPKVGRHIGVFDTSKVKALQPAEITPSDLSALAKGDASPTGPVITRDEARGKLGLAPWADVEHPEDAEPEPEPAPVAEPVDEEPDPAPVAEEDTTSARRMLTRVIRQALSDQRTVVEQRSVSRRGRHAASLAEHLDPDWQLIRSAATLEPILSYLGLSGPAIEAACRHLVEGSADRLRAASDVAGAYADAEQRVSLLVEDLLSARKAVPVGYLVALLDGVRQGKVTEQRALELWEGMK